MSASAAPDATTDVAAARRERAVADAAAAPANAGRERFKLAKGEDWHPLPTGGEVGIVLTDAGHEQVVQLSAGGRASRGVSVLAFTVLIDAGRL